jgi:septum formation protein
MYLLKSRQLILASQSPRRKQLLEELGIPFLVQPADIDESFPPDMPTIEVAEYIAVNKALAILPNIAHNHLVLAADSVVILDDQIFGKPTDANDAKQMIKQLAGKRHTVITGVCLASQEKIVRFSGITYVTMHPMNDAEIAFYVDTYQPMDKAGSYGVQEWIGLAKIAHIEGTYTNVMGLPVDLVYQALIKF